MAAPIILPRVEEVPAELRQYPQWVAWNFGGGGKKLPINPRTGNNAAPDNPLTWTNFGAAYRYAQKHGYGVGFVFTENDPYCGIDFDDCRDAARGTITVETWERIAALGSYTEVSPSGTGLKVFLKARVDRAHKSATVEVYDRGRFFTVTGQHLQGTPETIEERQAEVDALIAEVFGTNGHSTDPIPGKIPEGERNNTLASLAGSLRRRGLSEEVIERTLLEVNRAQCDPPLGEDEVKRIARSVARYEPQVHEAPVATPGPPPPGRTLAEVIGTFQRWLHMPDPAPLELALAAVVANKAAGDPVWLLLVGVPGSGKTEIITALTADPAVRLVGTITEGSLLSGVSKRDTTKGAKGGLLREIGAFGILAPKDFTTVLAMNRDSKSQVLAALREIYDGTWVRWVGTDGGRKLEWRGKIGLIGGCTNAIDAAHAVMGTLGERFVFCRIPPEGRHAVANRALGHAGQEAAMRSELAAAVEGLLAHTTAPQGPVDLMAGETERLVALADLATVCRAPVVRDSYRREIEDVPGAEMPTRVVIVFKLLFGALQALGVDRARIWTLLERVALDSMPLVRRNALSVLFGKPEADTQEIATGMKVPTITARRGLEDLAAYGVVDRIVAGAGLPDRWRLSEWARTTLRTTGISEIPASVWGDDVPTTFSENPVGVWGDDVPTTFSENPVGVAGDAPSFLSLNTPNTTTDGKTEKVSNAEPSEPPPGVGDLVWCLGEDGCIQNERPLKIEALQEYSETGELYAVFEGGSYNTRWPLKRCEVVSAEEADVWTL